MRHLARVLTFALSLSIAPLQLAAEDPDPFVYDYDQAGYVDEEAGLVWAEFDIYGLRQAFNFDHISATWAAEDYAKSPWRIPYYGPLSEDPDPVNDLFTLTNHLLLENQAVRLDSSGELPFPLLEGVDYYAIVVDQDTFRLSATIGGDAIDFEGTGTGDLGQWIDYKVSFEAQRAVAIQYDNWRLPTVDEFVDAYQKGLFDLERGYLIQPEIPRWTLDTRGTKAYRFRTLSGEVEIVHEDSFAAPIAVRSLNPEPPGGGGPGKGKNK